MLLEADFNVLHENIFNGRMIPVLEVQNEIPYKIIGSRQTQVAMYLVLNKKLIVDIANVRKRLMFIIYADTTNCHDRVVYPFASLHT